MQAQNDEYDVLIVGAGWYGLIAAYTYLKLAPETKLLILDDGDTLGGVWNSERIYPNLFAQVGHGLFEYSFYPMKKEGLTKDRYISAKTIHDYLQSFAKDYDLVRRIRCRTKVTSARRFGSKWILTLNDDEACQVTGSKLIAATGVTSGPHVPDFPRDGFVKPIIHSGEIGSHIETLLGPEVQRATVLGAAKSAYDTVFFLLKAGKKVDWIIRDDGSGPLAIMPPRLGGLLNTVDVMGTRALASFSPAILNTSGIWYQLLQKTAVGNYLTKVFWRSVSWMAEQHAGYSKNPNTEKLQPIPRGYGVFWANAGLGLASAPDYWKVIHAGDLTVHRTEITGFSDGNKVHLKNGETLETDHVTLCTGWTDNLGMFDEATRAEYGLPSQADWSEEWAKLDAAADEVVLEKLPFLRRNSPNTRASSSHMRPWRLYRRLVSPRMAAKGDRSAFFPGQIHSVYTPLVAEMQALWGVAYLLGRLDLPTEVEMKKEYVDTLARDMGLNTSRKSNMFSEMFLPYRPRDWRGLISEFLQAEKMRRGREKGLEGKSGDDSDTT
ncbi:FAD/NAD(P)-binding domain-containing protein [Sodiomyces alkalinus F11]|uniref:FAD/NAD(P)-binding domain-containing protein n=1 Tax=Sodiomyces alkalinus (strain CBS 110278 / VKM F-3762 / F11) TaxID=1314773 RepID=A0A3N2Q2V6_SODAK|nr:FAD/NAD(P)-binding domain-containing protein [Sodiomyces alkalinus F11]ROT41101.1 FAD/NAD(P)-binding domain-containing protein [Sodiomyces alkalinus F11]